LGGVGAQGASIVVDDSGNAYVTGTTNGNFPVTPGAYQTVLEGAGAGAGFVSKLNPDGTGLVYSTYLGGAIDIESFNTDGAFGIAVDSSGNAYVTGKTIGGVPVTADVFPIEEPHSQNAFVTKFNAAGSGLIYSTYLADSSSSPPTPFFEVGNGIALDGSGNAYVVGTTNSANFAVTTGAFQTALGGGKDAFVAKLAVPATASPTPTPTRTPIPTPSRSPTSTATPSPSVTSTPTVTATTTPTPTPVALLAFSRSEVTIHATFDSEKGARPKSKTIELINKKKTADGASIDVTGVAVRAYFQRRRTVPGSASRRASIARSR
jgi:hypothetical protein